MSDNDLVKRGDVRKLADWLETEDGEILVVDMDDVDDILAAPHEMSAVEYLKVRERMASELAELCSECHCEGKCWSCSYHTPDTEDEMKHPDRSVALVEKWAREHPERSENEL